MKIYQKTSKYIQTAPPELQKAPPELKKVHRSSQKGPPGAENCLPGWQKGPPGLPKWSTKEHQNTKNGQLGHQKETPGFDGYTISTQNASKNKKMEPRCDKKAAQGSKMEHGGWQHVSSIQGIPYFYVSHTKWNFSSKMTHRATKMDPGLQNISSFFCVLWVRPTVFRVVITGTCGGDFYRYLKSYIKVAPAAPCLWVFAKNPLEEHGGTKMVARAAPLRPRKSRPQTKNWKKTQKNKEIRPIGLTLKNKTQFVWNFWP